jgi:sulfite dehydrogenase (quinone) subunit SoeC
MHPAYSVIVFTCASGAGYGLLIWLALSGLVGSWTVRLGATAPTAFVLSFVLITVGLLSSTAHLGRPERAWRAFSQWQTSWLSREGVLAVLTYGVGGPFALVWMFGDPTERGFLAVLGFATLLSATATLWCTGMIYGSLTTIRSWNMPHVAPLYVVFGLLTGRLLLNVIVAITAGGVSGRAIGLTLLLGLTAWLAKAHYWTTIDGAARTWTIGDATGLGRFGQVRPLDPPHTQANFVMREMGFQVARKHALRLRRASAVLLFLMPIVFTCALSLGTGIIAQVSAMAALLCAAVGVIIERWLFFAEAEHVSMLYYGREAV